MTHSSRQNVKEAILRVEIPVENRYKQEFDQWIEYLSDDEKKRLSDTWLKDNTVDAWRHARMYSCLDPVLDACPDSNWLTVGDGRYGNDSHYILEKGNDAVASDISDALLKLAAENMYIEDFFAANAENLPFAHESFDFVFCKESLHHFPRPMIALYEMLRVAKRGVVLIEPKEGPSLQSGRDILKSILKFLLSKLGLSSIMKTRYSGIFAGYTNAWEPVGNYVYKVSEREIEKVAMGMECPVCAFKGLNDYYERGVEFEEAKEGSLLSLIHI